MRDLGALTKRPYTLALIRELIPNLERIAAKGEALYNVTLYREIANHWLERDLTKHLIKPAELFGPLPLAVASQETGNAKISCISSAVFV